MLGVGIRLGKLGFPSPWGEGGAHAPGAGKIPVLADNRTDLDAPLIRRFAAPSP